MKSKVTSIIPVEKEYNLNFTFSEHEFRLFCRMMKYTKVIPDALRRAPSSSGWTSWDAFDLENLLKEMKKQLAPFIFESKEE